MPAKYGVTTRRTGLHTYDEHYVTSIVKNAEHIKSVTPAWGATSIAERDVENG